MKMFIALIVMSVFLCQCKNNKDKTPDEMLKEIAKSPTLNAGRLDISFILPAGWHMRDTVMQGIKVLFILKDTQTDDYAPNINVTTESMRSLTHADYVIETKKFMVNNFSGINTLNDGRFNVLGKECLWNTYTETHNGVIRERVFYSIAIDSVSYNITAGVSAGGLKIYRPVFDSIVKTFKLNN